MGSGPESVYASAISDRHRLLAPILNTVIGSTAGRDFVLGCIKIRCFETCKGKSNLSFKKGTVLFTTMPVSPLTAELGKVLEDSKSTILLEVENWTRDLE